VLAARPGWTVRRNRADCSGICPANASRACAGMTGYRDGGCNQWLTNTREGLQRQRPEISQTDKFPQSLASKRHARKNLGSTPRPMSGPILRPLLAGSADELATVDRHDCHDT
jgi:hypothetical protein